MTKPQPWYEALFQNYAEKYDKECYVQGTEGEVDFIEAEFGHDKSKRILDIGCGTGRHSIELARRGWTVTGIDLSESQLAGARRKAEAAGVEVEFLRRDARDVAFGEPFGGAIMICEGGFSLMETDEENEAILGCASAAIAEGGKLILTTLNALFPLFHDVQKFINENEVTTATDCAGFDLMTFRQNSTMTFTDDSGNEKTITCTERFYTPAEMTKMLKQVGFAKVAIHGCKLGAYSREHALTPDDFEMLVIGRKGR